jgi:hypothetical protein
MDRPSTHANARHVLRSACLLLLGVVLFPSAADLHADGGSVRLSERKGGYRISVFTSPTPLRAGTVDISVFVQDVASGEPVPQARILVRATPRDQSGEALCHPATTEAATNKLFQAAVFNLPQSGWWDMAIAIEGLREPLEVHFDMEVGEPLPRLGDLALWIAWPAAAILLFCVHRWLVGKKARSIKKGRLSRGEPALVTLSPNQRDTNINAPATKRLQERID